MEHSSESLSDNELVIKGLQGDRRSLEILIGRYNDMIYNISAKMVQHRDDAADITQEVLIKVITKLDTFKHDSSFKTWLYRITVNHILNFVKSQAARSRVSFDRFGEMLDGAPDLEFTADDHYAADKALLIGETKQTCMSGMLLCLDKKQRLVFILGELFGFNDKIGSEFLGIAAANFRMILSRAKGDLYNFMQNKCGLVNTNNPCRCAKKTKAFIKAGFVIPEKLRFKGDHLMRIETVSGERQKDLEDLYANEYRKLFLDHTYLQGPDFNRLLSDLLSSDRLNNIFDLK
jgi:RNA polymerase sigma factor (sigma-70 family)